MNGLVAVGCCAGLRGEQAGHAQHQAHGARGAGGKQRVVQTEQQAACSQPAGPGCRLLFVVS